MIRIVWTHCAIVDLEHIRSYIAQDSEYYAQALIHEIFQSVDQLQRFPQSGRIVPEINEAKTRELIVGSYRLIYEIKGSTVAILTVLHGARLLKKLQ